MIAPLDRYRAVRRCTAVLALLVVAELASTASAQAQAPNPLPVPWFGQGYCQYNCKRGITNWNGRNNCGPASAIMVGLANGVTQPAGTTRAQWVRQVKAHVKGTDQCPAGAEGLTRAELDNAAGYLGLSGRDELWTTEKIKATTEKCLPVITLLDGDSMPWKRNASFYKGIDHFVVTTGFQGSSTVKINDPLEASGSLGCPAPSGENQVYGSAHTQYNRADYDKAAYAANYGWWGKAYGNVLGDCAPPGPGGGPSQPPNNQLLIRVSSHCATNQMDVFFTTSSTPDYFSESRKKTVPLINDGVFRSYNIVFDGRMRSNHYKGTLRKLRFDVTSTPGCLFAVSFIGVHNGTTLKKGWTFPNGTAQGGWWARDAVTQPYIGPFWALVSTTGDSWIENDGINVAID